MRIPVIRGRIERRILANFRIDPEVMARVLPEPFRPKLAGGIILHRQLAANSPSQPAQTVADDARETDPATLY